MGKANALLYAFNRGCISPQALARTDLKVQALSAEQQTNWMPRALGSMMLRPGWGWVDSTYQNKRAVHLPFMRKLNDTAILELTDQLLRVRVNEAIVTRGAVASTITNGNFTSNIAGWTSADEAGALSQWGAGPPNFMSLAGTGINRAIRWQSVTVAGGDVGHEHALRIVVGRGNVTLRVGTTAGDDSYIANTVLGVGTHSLAFTPAGNFVVQVANATVSAAQLYSLNIEAAGAMTLPTPWLEADLGLVRIDESVDVLFVAAEGYAQYKIERRGVHSWSIVKYLVDDGPFKLGNVDQSIVLRAGALQGDTQLASSIPFFKTSHVGSLFRLTSVGQVVNNVVGGDGQFSNPVRITGVGGQRAFHITLTGTWATTLTLQRSVGAVGAWVDVQDYSGNTSTDYNDALDNQIIFYRIGFKTGNYSSGSATVALSYASGSLTGIARVTGFFNNTLVSASVITPFGATTGTTVWSEGQWSPKNGYPTSVRLYEGRLWWFGQDRILGSVSDAFASFDDTVVGDSGPISRSIGSGPVDTINWGLGLQRLLLGGENAEFSIRSSSLEEPLTPTNFNIKSPSTRGSAKVGAIKIDTNGIYVQRGDPAGNNLSGDRLIQLAYQGVYAIIDYATSDLSIFAPELFEAGIVRIGVQRKLDTRIHCVLSDGTAVICVYDPLENLKAMIPITTDGLIEDVVILPGGIEDKVYYTVNRTINAVTKRYLEHWALESECTGGTLNKQADCFITVHNGSPATVITGLGVLEGKNVVVWADGKDVGTVTADDGTRTQLYTVSGGQITLLVAATDVVVGLYYEARFKSAKLAYAAQAGTALTQVKSIDHLGLILRNTHAQGLRYGADFDSLDSMPGIEDGAPVPADYIWGEYDKEAFEIDDAYGTDSRLCLLAAAPRPCNILAAVIGLEVNERV